MFDYIKLIKEYNTIDMEHEVLKEYVKHKCLDELLKKVGEPLEIKRLREENKRLRLKNKELKKMIK